MRNLFSGLVSGACLVILWAVLTKSKRGYHYIGRMNGIPPSPESLPPLLTELYRG